MIRSNELLILSGGKKFKTKDIIFGQSGRVRVQVWFDSKIYGFFGFRLEKSCSEPKTFGQARVGFSGQVNFC